MSESGTGGGSSFSFFLPENLRASRPSRPCLRGPSFSADRYRATPSERTAFATIRNAERAYGRQLRTIARYVADLCRAFKQSEERVEIEPLTAMLNRYAELLFPWARAVATKMLADVNRRDDRAWRSYAALLGVELERELRGPTGNQLQRLLNDQIDLITSIPRDAALRVQELATGELYTGLRGASLVEEILRTGEVTKSRAELIARTEVARAASNLTELRARSVGSTHYVWRAAIDRNVRPSHRRMNGKIVAWDDPPVVDEGKPPYHAGCTYNCRCYAEPIINL